MKIELRDIKESGYFYGALLYVFMIPFYQQVNSIILGIWILLSLISFDKSFIVRNRFLLLLPLMYVLYFIGIFTAENPSFRFVESKLSFLAFPLLFFLNPYSAKQRNTLLKTLVYGLLLSGLACLLFATYRSVHYDEGIFSFSPNVLSGKGIIESILYGGNYYFGKFFSVFHQTVYFAMYLSVGLIILLFKTDLFSKTLKIIGSLAIIVLLFLISNKAGLITLGLILVIRTLTMKIALQKKLGVFSILIFVLGALILLNPRTALSIEKIYGGSLRLDDKARYGFSTRLLSWDAALDLIKEKPLLGHGFGDSQEKLNAVYKKKGYTFPLKGNFNTHNQWFQSWIENGILGLVVLGSVFFTVFRKEIKNDQISGFVLAIAVTLLLNSLFESIFNRFSGVSFFSFLVCYIITISNKEKLNL